MHRLYVTSPFNVLRTNRQHSMERHRAIEGERVGGGRVVDLNHKILKPFSAWHWKKVSVAHRKRNKKIVIQYLFAPTHRIYSVIYSDAKNGIASADSFPSIRFERSVQIFSPRDPDINNKSVCLRLGALPCLDWLKQLDAIEFSSKMVNSVTRIHRKPVRLENPQVALIGEHISIYRFDVSIFLAFLVNEKINFPFADVSAHWHRRPNQSSKLIIIAALNLFLRITWGHENSIKTSSSSNFFPLMRYVDGAQKLLMNSRQLVERHNSTDVRKKNWPANMWLLCFCRTYTCLFTVWFGCSCVSQTRDSIQFSNIIVWRTKPFKSGSFECFPIFAVRRSRIIEKPLGGYLVRVKPHLWRLARENQLTANGYELKLMNGTADVLAAFSWRIKNVSIHPLCHSCFNGLAWAWIPERLIIWFLVTDELFHSAENHSSPGLLTWDK